MLTQERICTQEGCVYAGFDVEEGDVDFSGEGRSLC